MKEIVQGIKKVLPEPVKEVLRRIIYRRRYKRFKKPYLKKKNVEGVTFDFWIGDRDGCEWYDLQSTDPDWPEMRFIRDYMIEQGDIVLECGGHHGCTAIVLSNWVGPGGKVITFEASQKNCDIIARNIEQNKLKNLTLVRKAVGPSKGKVAITEASNSGVVTSGHGIEVELTRLDEYESLNPTFIKIDVEGFEVQVLRGAEKILSKRPKMAIEIHARQLSAYGDSVEDIFKMIGAANYKFWVQWGDNEPPEEYDMKTPIQKRVHLFCMPVGRNLRVG